MSMLPESFKADVLEIIEIAKACPEALQSRCLELLLEHYLSGAGERRQRADTTTEVQSVAPAEEKNQEQKKESKTEDAVDSTTSANGGGDIALADLHVKARKFLEKFGRTLAELNDLFYKDGSEFKPLYDDLKTTKISESQVRVALLHALVGGMKDGEFQFDGEKVRAYDGGNFSANFSNNAVLFDGFEKYSKTSPVIRLSEAGRKKLAELIPELK